VESRGRGARGCGYALPREVNAIFVLRDRTPCPRDEFLDTGRAFFHQDARGFFVAQAVAGLERIFQVKTDFIVIAKGRRRYHLRVLRVGFRDLTFRQTQNAARGRKFYRGPQTRDACTHDDEIGFEEELS